ncbi:ParA family protein [Salinigranum marinum]|uniref:ParA family protein n=1 Tax=Salinigranum marinum TaxID=1515595 RepID=UPI002989D6A0|nr:ParA family protein [Salinigranum marinum]
MQAYTVYNQSGGQGKTTVARDLAAAHAEIGQRVLVIDMDAQNGSLSNYLGVDENKRDPEVDDLTFHLVEQGQGEFRDLIRTAEPNVDVLPSHKRLNRVDEFLDSHANYIGQTKPDDWEYPRYERLLAVLRENDVPSEYDVVIIDPNAKADTVYYMALYATRNVVIPAVPTRSGFESIDGVADSAQGFAENQDINIGRTAVVPTMVDMRKGDHKDYAQKLRCEYDAPVYFKSLSAFESAEEQYVSVFRLFDEHRDRIRKSEQNILPKYRTLVATICATFGNPLPEDAWDGKKLFTGDDFWGEVEIPFAEAVVTDETVDQTAGVN